MNTFENTKQVLCSALSARRSLSYLKDSFLPILAPARRCKRDQDGASLQLSPEIIRMLSNATISNSFISSLRKIRSMYQPTVLPRNSPIYTKKKKRIPNAHLSTKLKSLYLLGTGLKRNSPCGVFPLSVGNTQFMYKQTFFGIH